MKHRFIQIIINTYILLFEFKKYILNWFTKEINCLLGSVKLQSNHAQRKCFICFNSPSCDSEYNFTPTNIPSLHNNDNV